MSLESLPATGSYGKRKKDGDDFQGKKESGSLSASSAEDLLGHCPKTELFPVDSRSTQPVWIHDQKSFS